MRRVSTIAPAKHTIIIINCLLTKLQADRIHVKIQDAANSVYQVPESVFPRPTGQSGNSSTNLLFNYTESPFSFSIVRPKTGEILFDTSAASLVFESQYLRLRTSLPENPNLYGMGEHSDPFRLNTTNYIRTLWSQDAYGIPAGANLYGNHPIYFDHRVSGTHGVFFLNSNGMDVKINNTDGRNQYLEYNTLGGVLDFYFMAGPTPIELAKQYAEVTGLPTMQSYWSFGYHNCRYGYQDTYEVAEVVYNYSSAGIPLETMWTDIDYMDRRRVLHAIHKLERRELTGTGVFLRPRSLPLENDARAQSLPPLSRSKVHRNGRSSSSVSRLSSLSQRSRR